MKYAIATLVVGLGLVAAAPASASSDRCAAPNRCTAATADSHVDLASVRTGRDTRGVWRLSCTKGSQSSVQKGGIGKGGRRLIVPELSNADCTLVARGRAPGEIAVVRVALS